MPVLGIGNGFQILCEAGMLPGALIANRDLAFICRFVDLEVVDNESILTRSAQIGQRIRIPLNSYEGNWVDPGNTGGHPQIHRRSQRFTAGGGGCGQRPRQRRRGDAPSRAGRRRTARLR